MTPKRIFLLILTIVAIAAMGMDLITSWSQPQFQSRLELSQTDLVLQASAFQGDQTTRKALIDAKPEEAALKTYQETLGKVDKAIATAEAQLSKDTTGTFANEVKKQELLKDELRLRIGILQAQQKKPDEALKTWETVSQNSKEVATAKVLSDLWRDAIPVAAEPTLTQNLDGWFETRSLEKLYTLQQRSDAIEQLKVTEQQASQQALVRLAAINGLPAIAILSGIGVLLFLIGQRLIKGKQSLLSGTNDITWTVPWDGEIVWQVLVVGFFFVGQILIGQSLPVLVALARSADLIDPTTWGAKEKAVLSLVTYLALATGGLSVLYGSIRSFLPLPSGWFRLSLKGNWWLWGLGGYVAAYPLIVAVSWVNNQIWQGRGGSNPILPIVLEGRDPIAFGIFLVTAAIAAPLFEETFFRGFLLPSLTKYFSTWQAILLSSVLFAVVHLSLSEVIPLTVLGTILAFVYTRTQNLMASILLHALWNAGMLLTLFFLGGTST